MNVLQRKMFAAGDEVLGTRSSGSYLLPKAITTTLSKEGEDFFAIETDAQGNVPKGDASTDGTTYPYGQYHSD